MQLTRHELAELFDLTSQTVGKWPLQPVGKRGHANVYDLKTAIRYRLDQATDGGDLKDARHRWLSAKADREALRLATDRGDYLEATEVRRTWTQVLHAVRAKVLQIPHLAAPAVVGEPDPKRVRRILEQHAHQALTDLALAGESGTWVDDDDDAPEGADDCADGDV